MLHAMRLLPVWMIAALLSGSTVDGDLSEWGPWTTCGVSCGVGVHSRSRTCDGGDCLGHLTETGECNNAPCFCDLCSTEGGTCLDTDGDGLEDVCHCPRGKRSTDNCDLNCGLVDHTCDSNEAEPCRDLNAECALGQDVTGLKYCTCRLGYVAISDEGERTCNSVISRVHDVTCQDCIVNDGICYDSANDTDSLKDGCLCPPTRTTVHVDCDTELFGVQCTAESMTVCYHHHNIAELLQVFDDIGDGEANLYAKDFKWDKTCHFKEVDNDYCITLDFQEQNCGLALSNVSRGFTYSQEILLQKNVIAQQCDSDISVTAYCRFDQMKKISTGTVEVYGIKERGKEGKHHRATLAMTVTNRDGKDLRSIGHLLGDMVKVGITMTDDAGGVFTALRAEVCLISDQFSLRNPDARTVPLVVNSCSDGVLDAEDNFRIVEGNRKIIQTGYFHTPKFADVNRLFVHCAVRVCRNSQECMTNCRRRRRRLERRARANLLGALAKKGLQQETAIIEVLGLYDDYSSGERSAHDMSNWSWFGVGLVLAVLFFITVVLSVHSRQKLLVIRKNRDRERQNVQRQNGQNGKGRVV